MADIIGDSGQAEQNHDVDFTFEDGGDEHVGGDDFDFELDGGETLAAKSGAIASAASASTVDLPSSGGNQHTIVETEEISFDATDRAAAEEPAVDEINYEEEDAGQPSVDQTDGPDTESSASMPQAGTTRVIEEVLVQTTTDFDFGLNDSTTVPDVSAFPAANLGMLDNPLDVSIPGLDDGQVDMSGNLLGQISNTLDLGFDALTNDVGAVPDVTVTWGEEVCPLFKTAQNQAQGSFYVEDPSVANLPLSSLLASIRTNIAEWVDDNDEIYIQVIELGVEFGETTTEALVGQVTFMNLVALHHTLVKNDNPNATPKLNLILDTRTNNALRIKELVNAAKNGKGLSVVKAHDSPEAASSPSADEDGVSQDLSPDEMEDDASEQQSSIEQEEAESDGANDAQESEDAEDAEEVEGDEDQDDELDLDEFGEDEQDGQPSLGVDAEADVEYDDEHYQTVLEYPEEPTDDIGYHDRADEDQIGLQTTQEAEEAADELLAFDDEEDEGGGLNGTHEDFAPGEYLGDDEYLDLTGDAGEDALLGEVEANGTATKVTTQLSGDLGAASSTNTLQGDEIDYEDLDTTAPGQAQTAVDEIDWDDDDKVTAANAGLSTPTTGKRGREADDGDGLHQDERGEQPSSWMHDALCTNTCLDLKRHRLEDATS
jgi:hypothetical protein